MADFDFIVIGSGIAGASAACEISALARVLLVEREDVHGYHTTGRSAALYSAAYGNAAIRALTLASRPFFDKPPQGFASHPLLHPRGCVYIARSDQNDSLTGLYEAARSSGVRIDFLSRDEVITRCPIIKPDYVTAGAWEPGAMDIDVNAVHQGFLRHAKERGCVIRVDAGVAALDRRSSQWLVRFTDGTHAEAAVVVNAAGAWADRVAGLAGVGAIGVQPLRRTAMILEPPPHSLSAGWPMINDADENFYFKPESGKILASPADETPSEPCDAMPDELDVAICIDRIQQAADLPVRRVLRSWAGLRSFSPDRTLVLGYDDEPGFFWVAGQGGYGIQTAPAAGRAAAALALHKRLPEEIAAFGVSATALSPMRFRA